MAGEFKSPGRYPWTNGMTLKDGVDLAGGFTGSHWLRIYHWDESTTGYRLRRDWQLTNNPALKAGDFISTVRDL